MFLISFQTFAPTYDKFFSEISNPGSGICRSFVRRVSYFEILDLLVNFPLKMFGANFPKDLMYHYGPVKPCGWYLILNRADSMRWNALSSIFCKVQSFVSGRWSHIRFPYLRSLSTSAWYTRKSYDCSSISLRFMIELSQPFSFPLTITRV